MSKLRIILFIAFFMVLIPRVFADGSTITPASSKTKKETFYRIKFPVETHQLNVDLPIQTSLEEVIGREQKPSGKLSN